MQRSRLLDTVTRISSWTGGREGEVYIRTDIPRSLSAPLQVQPRQQVQHRQLLGRVARPRMQPLRHDLNCNINLLVLRIRQRDIHPELAGGPFVLEQRAKFRGVLRERIRVNFDHGGLVIVILVAGRYGNVNAVGDVRVAVSAEGEGAVCEDCGGSHGGLLDREAGLAGR